MKFAALFFVVALVCFAAFAHAVWTSMGMGANRAAGLFQLQGLVELGLGVLFLAAALIAALLAYLQS